MLTRIDLTHFKCFDLLKLPLRRLTLLSGANASGKSSVLQALVLLNQTMRESPWSDRLLLNGGTMRLGTVADVVDQRARRSCRIALRAGEHEVGYPAASSGSADIATTSQEVPRCSPTRRTRRNATFARN